MRSDSPAFSATGSRACPPETHGPGDGEMDLALMELRTGGNGIEARLQFLEESDEFSRCKMQEWMPQQQVYDFAAPEKFG